MEFSKRLKFYRKKYMISQEELSKRLFTSRQTISKWENDKSYPDLNSLILLSNIFDISLDELIKGDINIMKKDVVRNNLMENALFFFSFLLLLYLYQYLQYYFMVN